MVATKLLGGCTRAYSPQICKLEPQQQCDDTARAGAHGLEESRERKHVEADSVERGYNESFSVGPEFNRAAEFARKAAEESASANAFSKEAYQRCSKAFVCWLEACANDL